MAIAINRIIFENLDIRSSITNTLLKLDKFILKSFNWLLYIQKISRLLVVSFLFDLINHYFIIVVVKTLNIILLKTKFELILSDQDFN